MKLLVTVLYALVLISLVQALTIWSISSGHPLLGGFIWFGGITLYLYLMWRRVQRHHPENPPPPPPGAEEGPLDELIASAQPRDPAAPQRRHDDTPRTIAGPPPRGVLGIEQLAGVPAPAVGPNPTYRITVLAPNTEGQRHTYWINEDRMLHMLDLLVNKYFVPGWVRPRVKIEPVFDLRVANIKAKQARDPRNPPFNLPEGLRAQFVGLLG